MLSQSMAVTVWAKYKRLQMLYWVKLQSNCYADLPTAGTVPTGGSSTALCHSTNSSWGLCTVWPLLLLPLRFKLEVLVQFSGIVHCWLAIFGIHSRNHSLLAIFFNTHTRARAHTHTWMVHCWLAIFGIHTGTHTHGSLLTSHFFEYTHTRARAHTHTHAWFTAD